jgi:NADH-quinone oxidoreductase subunit M
MVQSVIYGNLNTVTEKATDISLNVKLVLVIIAITIIVFGVFPQPMIDLTKTSVEALFVKK